MRRELVLVVIALAPVVAALIWVVRDLYRHWQDTAAGPMGEDAQLLRLQALADEDEFRREILSRTNGRKLVG